MHILIVDDEKRATEALKDFLEEDHKISVCYNGKQALALLAKEQFDVVITDHNMPEMTGLELIKEGKKLYEDCFFMMLTAHSSLDHAIQALRLGADDYLVKPVDFNELETRVLRCAQLLSYKNKRKLEGLSEKALEQIKGKSARIEQVKEMVLKIADVPTPVLLLGESGAGKELFAKAIHESGKRKTEPFVAINCATLSEQLLESELFGHEKGAFTGAEKSKPGKFELAREGTLFLDEIGELAPSLQAKLLRVLQEKEYYRVGGTRLLRTNCRILAATHQNLAKMVDEGSFRKDLFFRLNVLTLELPTLNERKEDIPILVDHFVNRLRPELGSQSELHESVLEYLCSKEYVGNVRELKNEIERILVLNQSKKLIQISDLNQMGSSPPVSSPQQNFEYKDGLNHVLESLEKELVAQALKDHGDNQVQTAKALGITRGALQYKIQKYELANATKKAA